MTLVNLTLLGFGVAITLHDLGLHAHNQFRALVRTQLDTMVLDDVLRSIFDPVEGTIAVITSTIVGNASMYSLPLTQQQRVKLVQSCLWTSDEQSNEILTRPGGIAQLLPRPVQKWLHPEQNTVKPVKIHTMQKFDLEEDAPTDEEGDSVEEEEEEELATEDEEMMDGDLDTDGDSDSQRQAVGKRSLQPPPTTTPQLPTPVEAFTSIAKELLTTYWKNASESVPDSVLGTVSVVAAAACALHLAASPRARRIAAGAVEGTLTLTFCSAAVAAGSALLIKRGSATNISDLMKQLVEKAKSSSKLSGVLSLAVLYYFGRRRRR